MECQDDERRKLSFSYDVCGEKLRLIDVSQEDDFLIESPLFDSLEDLRLSAFDGAIEDEDIRFFRPQRYEAGKTTEETIQKKEQNLSTSCSMEPARPSYLRKSLAWDSAFFNSAGVLDYDELAFLNRGLKAVEDIRMRRAETKSSFHGSMKIDIGQRSKIKSKAAFQEHSTQRSEKTKIKHNSQSEEPSWKHPKASERRMRTSLNEYDAGIKNAAKLGKHMMHSKKSALLNSCSLLPSGYENSITFSPYKTSNLSGSSKKIPPALVRGKTESQKGKLCASTSPFATPARLIKGNKELGYPKNVTYMSPTPRSKRKQQADSSSLSLQREEIDSTAKMNEETVAHTSPVSTEPRKKFKPSGLRQPSPKLGFFDEEKAVFAKGNGGLQFQPKVYGKIDGKTPAKPLQENTSLGKSHNILQSAPGIKGRRNLSSDKKLWNSSSRVSSTMKSWSEVSSRRHTSTHVGMEEEERTCYNKSRKIDALEDDRKQVKRRVKKNASSQNFQDDEEDIKTRRTPFNWEDQVSDLSKYFDIIDLNKDILLEFKDNNKIHGDRKSILDDQKQALANISPNSSDQLSHLLSDDLLPSSRTPLADRTSVCNQNGSFKSPGEISQGKLARKEPACSSFEGTDGKKKASKGFPKHSKYGVK